MLKNEVDQSTSQTTKHKAEISPLIAKVTEMIIPTATFQNTSLEEALEFLKVKTRELSPEPEEERTLLNFFIHTGEVESSGTLRRRAQISIERSLQRKRNLTPLFQKLNLRDIPFSVALQSCRNATRLESSVEGQEVTISTLDKK